MEDFQRWEDNRIEKLEEGFRKIKGKSQEEERKRDYKRSHKKVDRLQGEYK